MLCRVAPRHLSLVLSASLLLACDGGEKAPAAQPEAAPASAKPAVAPPVVEPGEDEASIPGPRPLDPGTPAKPAAKPAANNFQAPTRAQATEHAQSLAAHLAAGRLAVKAKDYAAGIAELEAAAKINPLHAKTLGELGWAYFNAGQLDEAEDRLERGLQYADNDQTRGAILYNLGRVAEANGDKAHAIELYQRSLAVRPNTTVDARLIGLGGVAPSAGSAVANGTHAKCKFERQGLPARNLCLAYIEKLGADLRNPDSMLRCEYGQTAMLAEGETQPPNGAMAGDATDATLYDLKLDATTKVAVFSYTDADMMDESFVLAIVVDGVLYTAPLAWVSHPGAGYADENAESIEIRTEPRVPGGKPEIRDRVEGARSRHGPRHRDGGDVVVAADRRGLARLRGPALVWPRSGPNARPATARCKTGQASRRRPRPAISRSRARRSS